jgi:hypothetical protein
LRREPSSDLMTSAQQSSLLPSACCNFAAHAVERFLFDIPSTGRRGGFPYSSEPCMSSTALMRQRHRAFASQSGLCFYCRLPMWERDPFLFASRFETSVLAIGRFQCTAEHLKPRSCAGDSSKGNIVAACRFCNQTRHRAKNGAPAKRLL